MTVISARPLSADAAAVDATVVDSTTQSVSDSRIAALDRPAARLAPRPDFSVEGHPRRWLVLPVILTAMFMAMFDSSAGFSISYQ